MRITRWIAGTIFPLILLFIALPLSAQTYRGGIGGTVVDVQGAVVANVKVVLTSTDTGATRETITTSEGGFVFQDLQLGTYSLTVTASGFANQTLNGIAVNPGAVTPVNPKLGITEHKRRLMCRRIQLQRFRLCLLRTMPLWAQQGCV